MSSSANEFDKLRIPFQDVVSATNNFADENLIKAGGTADVYKGKLIQFGEQIDVAVRRVLTQHRLGRDEFLEEMKEFSLLIDKHIISIVGFCDENGENILLMEYAVKGSLDQYLSDPTLDWSQRLKICLGATRGFQSMTKISNYLSYTYTYRDIRCSKILLDRDGEAKISCFGLPKNKYGDMIGQPLGLIFLEVVYGRKAVIGEGGVPSLAAMAENNFQKEKLDEFMDPTLKKQIHPLSFTIFLQTAYDCLTTHPYTKTHVDRTVIRVEDALKVQLMHQNIENNMSHLKIPHNHILEATENFSERYLIYSYLDEKLYKAELGCLDGKSWSTTKEADKNELFTVAIQCISYNKADGREWFTKGFEMLASCKHPNIESLLGFSSGGPDLILVFEYPHNGSLRDLLGSVNTRNSLTWKQRVQISLDIARGLDYIHNMEEKLLIKPSGIISRGVFLDDKWNAKIVRSTLNERYPVKLYLHEKVMLIYSFGLLLFEILFGRLVNDAIQLAENAKKLEQIPRSLLDEETKRETVDQDSLDAFSKIAYQCLKVAQSWDTHLTMDFIIKQLEEALSFQMNHLDRLEYLKIPLSKIKAATKIFDKTSIIGSGGYGEVYKAELEIFDINHSLEIESKNKCQLPKKHKTVAIKRILNRKDEQGTEGFLMELNVLSKCKHPNIVCLLGYCMEDSEMILVYEYLANGSLDDYLGCTNDKKIFTWSQRIRVCLDIAYGIDYLHSTTKNKKMIIHRDIKSDNILFGNNWEVKLADFGLSKVHTNQSIGTIMTNNIAGTNLYLDPAYERHRRLKKESDIYSFGIVLFEILSGRLTYDSTYIMHDTRGIAPIARKHFKQGTIKEMVDPKIMGEAHEIFSSLKIGTTQASLDIFSKIAYGCLAKNQDDRPTIKDIIEELQKALSYDQEHRKGILKFSLEDINLGTENFSDENCIITEEHWKIYVGEIQSHAERKTILIKRLNKSSQEAIFFTELEVLYKHKHENVIRGVGYCNEDDEKIIVYEHASNGSLSMHLNKVSLGWKERLKICIDIAVGLHFLHEGVGTKEMVVHRNLKSSSIILNSDFRAKISDFGFSSITPISKHNNYAYNVYFPINTTPFDEWEMKFLTKQSDIYAFGVVLFQILSGGLALENYYVKEGKLDELVFPGIKEQIAPLSLATFHKIADQCIHHIRLSRPRAHDVEVQLRKALEIQEIWEPKMRKDDVKTIQLSESPNIDSKEIPFQNGRLWLHGERTELVSAMEFTYLNHRSRRWQSLQGSRFQKVAEMLDTWNLMIEIKTRCQYFSGDYGVYLVFKFRDLRKFSSQPIYVNLKYRKGSETLHAYFATWRDEEWMMIELFRMLNHKEAGNVHRFLLESFSSSCCGDDVIYVEGIEFRAIDNVKNEEIKMLQETHLQETQQVSVSNSIVNQVQQVFRRWRNYDESEKNIWQSEVNGKKHLMLSAKKVLLNFPNVNLFASKPSTQSRSMEYTCYYSCSKTKRRWMDGG